jgi:hypothetical protein
MAVSTTGMNQIADTKPTPAKQGLFNLSYSAMPVPRLDRVGDSASLRVVRDDSNSSIGDV